MEFLKALIVVSEKAANIARVIRENEHLFQLLVEKKSKEEANERFVEDFKTLADVLIQEMVKHEIGYKYPEIRYKIFGEESNEFTNKLGEVVTVEIKDTEEETSELLLRVLNGDKEAADVLAAEVHKDVQIEDVNTNIPKEDFDLEMDTLGVWIDPIDATLEYINAEEKIGDNGVYLSGLKCVTVLIGVFNQNTGLPVIGVVNRPFAEKTSDTYQCIWAVDMEGITIHTPCDKNDTDNWNKVICVSSSESRELKEKLREGGYEVMEAAGAGYKILTVILGLADAYVLSKSTTFFWDTCAPQAILRAIGGDVIIYEDATQKDIISVEYAFCKSRENRGGLIAYRKGDVLDDIINILANNSG